MFVITLMDEVKKLKKKFLLETGPHLSSEGGAKGSHVYLSVRSLFSLFPFLTYVKNFNGTWPEDAVCVYCPVSGIIFSENITSGQKSDSP